MPVSHGHSPANIGVATTFLAEIVDNCCYPSNPCGRCVVSDLLIFLPHVQHSEDAAVASRTVRTGTPITIRMEVSS
jgi:hypothetical protein